MKLQFKSFLSLLAILSITGSSILLNGCAEKSEGGQPPMQMATPVVGFKAHKQPIADKISLVGTLEANEIVEIRNEIDGVVEEINFEEGQAVKKGDLLILIDQKKLTASLKEAEANLKLAQSTKERYESLIANGAISRQEFDQAVNALEVSRAAVDLTKAQLKDSSIIAPFDGVVGRRMVSVGQFISKGTNLGSLISQDPIKANFKVPERYLSRIKEGQSVDMQVAAYPDESFSGEVFFVDPRIDELTRTALIKARLDNREGKLRHGMFANLQLTVNEKKDAIVIPETALILKGDDVQVFIVKEDETVDMKPIKVGIRLAGFVEVVEGLDENETVVVEGFQKLGPGAKAKVRFEDETAPVAGGHKVN